MGKVTALEECKVLSFYKLLRGISLKVLRGPVVLQSFVLIERSRLERKRERLAYVCSTVKKMRVNKA
jgi:hypothetical protein